MTPMEGLTGFVYRNALHRHFGGADKYFTQIPANRAEDFLCIAGELKNTGSGSRRTVFLRFRGECAILNK